MSEATAVDIELLNAQVVVDAHRALHDGPMPCCADAGHCFTLWYAMRLVKDRLGTAVYLDPPVPPARPHIPAPRPPIDQEPADGPHDSGGEFAFGLAIGGAAGVLVAIAVVGAALSTIYP